VERPADTERAARVLQVVTPGSSFGAGAGSEALVALAAAPAVPPTPPATTSAAAASRIQ
jgi:hypothetical protein